MDYKRIQIFSFLASVLVSLVWAQGNEIDAVRDVGSSLNQFTLQLLSDTADQAGDSINLALSPYTVWSLLTIIAEGARGETARQLEDVLHIPSLDNKDLFRRNYKSLTKYLTQQSNGVQLDVNSAIFATLDEKLNRTYQQLTKYYYGAEIIPTDFKNLVKSVNVINAYVAGATKNRIQNFVKIDDVIQAQILMVSTLFFKGQWRNPFNKTETFTDTFFDESGKAKGKVMMMTQLGTFPYTILKELNAHAIELPYGNGDRFSMIVVLPRKGITLSSVLKGMSALPFSYVLDAITNAEQQFGEEDVQVYLPRFTINSDLNMNAVLDQMGIKDAFNSEKADLLGIFPSNYLYLSRVIQQAKIEVNEEGTVATAAAGGQFQYKSPPPKFNANKDFAYFIVDKPTKSIIFAGKVSNPSTLCDTCARKNN